MTSPRSQIVALDVRLAGREGTGDSTYWLGLLHGLSEIESGLSFLLFSNVEKPREIPESDNFRWMTLPSGSSRFWSLARFPLAARRAGAHAIHTQYNLSPLAGRVGITTIHDVSFFIGPEWFKPRDLWLLRRFVPASAKRAAGVITVSETSRQDIERYVPAVRGKISVTSLARSPLIKPVEQGLAKQAAQRLGLAGPFLLTVGTRWPRKNMDLAVQAVEGLSDRFPHRLAITGKPGWGEESLGRRGFATGYLSASDLSALYSAADLYLAPSRHEGFGIPLLEAFACGCPVVCSSGGALPEVAGDAALVLKSWEPADWTGAVSNLLESRSKLDDLRARGRIREPQFTWTQTAQKTIEVYQNVIRNRS